MKNVNAGEIGHVIKCLLFPKSFIGLPAGQAGNPNHGSPLRTCGDDKRKLQSQTNQFQELLLRWFSAHRRRLPWREEKTNPYHIFVVEVMLQQTQIKTVLPYYERWLKTFPTIESLARAPIDRVLKLWEGLGYYTRARNLHKAAQMIVDKFGGKIPSDPNILQMLPGIGRYTAGAIASIGFQNPAPIVDGNVARLFSRIFNIKKDISELKTQEHMYKIARWLVPQKQPGAFNQALMELGSLVCISEMPRCHICPVSRFCQAFTVGNQAALPVRKNKTEIKKIEMVVGILKQNGRIFVRKRPPKGIWGGLWELPGTIRTKDQTAEEALRQEFKESLGINVRVEKILPPFDHYFTHRHAIIRPFYLQIVATWDGRNRSQKAKPKTKREQAFSQHIIPVPVSASSPSLWANPRQLNQLSFPVPHQKILKYRLLSSVEFVSV